MVELRVILSISLSPGLVIVTVASSMLVLLSCVGVLNVTIGGNFMIFSE